MPQGDDGPTENAAMVVGDAVGYKFRCGKGAATECICLSDKVMRWWFWRWLARNEQNVGHEEDDLLLFRLLTVGNRCRCCCCLGARRSRTRREGRHVSATAVAWSCVT
jgi:hypothetical protein